MTSSSTDVYSKRSTYDFRKFWAGQTISNLGASITLFALPLLIFNLTGSAFNLGLAMAVNFLPYLLFGLVIGAWIDRVDRKRIMIIIDVSQALVIASIPLLASINLLTIWWLYAVGFIGSTLKIGFEAGEFAAIPSLVRKSDLIKANSRIQATYSAAFVLGPLLAGLLVTTMTLEMLLLFDAVSFLLSALLLTFVSTSFNAPEVEERTPTSIGVDVIEGLRYVFRHPVLRNISAMMALINFAIVTTQAQLVLFAKERLGASDTQTSLLYSAGGVGIVILSLSASPLRKHLSFSKVALGALMIAGLLIVGLAFTQQYWAAFVLWALIMGFLVLFNISTNSLRQTIVPNIMLGRVQTVASVLAWSAIPLGSFLGGLLIEYTQDVALVYGAIGVLVFLIAFGFFFTALGQAERYLQQEKPSNESEQ